MTSKGGLYIHIPFCRQACRYCDFYFTVSLKYMDEFLDCLLTEMRYRSGAGEAREISSLYLGGGTPSLLEEAMLEKIMEEVHRNFVLDDDAEISLEANPDDLDREKLRILQKAGINRLSIGIQSFREDELRLMRRSHSADQARRSVMDAAGAGIENLSADLIYGIPGQEISHWKNNLQEAMALPLEHLSCYHLSFEEGTVFDHWRKKGRLENIPEEKSEQMFAMLQEHSHRAGYEHYEISNFARKGHYSRHNLLYWSGKSYLGLGPSAHSYDGKIRSWNAPSLRRYMDNVRKGSFGGEKETLDERDRYHDYVITSLRTLSGSNPDFIREQMGSVYMEYFLHEAAKLEEKGFLVQEAGFFRIPPHKWIMADHIMRELFMP